MRWSMLGLAVALGCGGEAGEEAEDCTTCAENGEICVVYADGDIEDWTEGCEALPADCTGADPCENTDCVVAMYDLCDDTHIGQSYSCADGGYISVTCSPDT